MKTSKKKYATKKVAPGHITIKSLSEKRIIPLANIVLCAADRSYTEVHLANREILTVCGRIKLFEKKLNPKYFCRCHRSYTINLTYVENIVRDKKTGKWYFVTKCGDKLAECSRRQKPKMIDIIEKFASENPDFDN